MILTLSSQSFWLIQTYPDSMRWCPKMPPRLRPGPRVQRSGAFSNRKRAVKVRSNSLDRLKRTCPLSCIFCPLRFTWDFNLQSSQSPEIFTNRQPSVTLFACQAHSCWVSPSVSSIQSSYLVSSRLPVGCEPQRQEGLMVLYIHQLEKTFGDWFPSTKIPWSCWESPYELCKTLQTHMEVSWVIGVPPINHPCYFRMFHEINFHHPAIKGYPHCWNPPHPGITLETGVTRQDHVRQWQLHIWIASLAWTATSPYAEVYATGLRTSISKISIDWLGLQPRLACPVRLKPQVLSPILWKFWIPKNSWTAGGGRGVGSNLDWNVFFMIVPFGMAKADDQLMLPSSTTSGYPFLLILHPWVHGLQHIKKYRVCWCLLHLTSFSGVSCKSLGVYSKYIYIINYMIIYIYNYIII